MDRDEKYFPADEWIEGVSQPNARELPRGFCRSANSFTVAPSNKPDCSDAKGFSDDALRISAAKRNRSGTFENRPA